MWFLFACASPPSSPSDPAGPAAPPAGDVALGVGSARPVELVLDRGAFDQGAWLSEPGSDRVVSPVVEQVGDRARLALAPGEYVAVIARSCGPVRVPFTIDPFTAIASLPYPRCGETGPDGRWSADDVAALHEVGLLLGWPVSGPDGVWGTYDEAVAACGWYGRALVARADPSSLPVWVVGGSVSLDLGSPVPLSARDHVVGVACGGFLEPL